MQRKTRPILAIDPGLRDLGFAVLAGRKIVAAGVLPLRLLPRSKRRAEAGRLIRSWLGAYRPGAVVLEATYRHPVPWLNELHRVTRTVARLAEQRRGLSVTAYAPQTVRKSLTGNGWSSKREVATALSCRFPALRVYLTQDRKWKERYWLNMFDAVALAVHHQARGK
jgi:crossover junction endodeoxyribonuclease RuvC